MNVYLVTDDDGVWVIVAADNRREALGLYPTEYGEHCRLLERAVDDYRGECDYLRTRGVDLIMGGVIQPNWYNDLHDASYDDYRGWNGFTDAATYPELVR